MDWVLGIERLRLIGTCGVIDLRLGYDEQGHPPSVLLIARATTSCLIDQSAAPSAAAFLLPCQGYESAEEFLQHNESLCSRRFVNYNDLDAFLCKRVLQLATEIRRLAKSTDEEQVLVVSLDWPIPTLEHLNALASTFLPSIKWKQLDSIHGTTSMNVRSTSSLVRVIRPLCTPCLRSLSQS